MSVQRVTVAPGHWLAPGPAAALTAAIAAGMPPEITDAGRTRAEQAELYREKGPKGAEHPDSPRAFHMTGEAVDLGRKATAWLLRHPEYGWRRTIASEWWHWQWFRSLATYMEDDVQLTDLIGTTNPANPAKKSTVAEALAIAQNYSFRAWQNTHELRAEIDALVRALAGEDIDLAAIRAAARDGVADALAAIETTVTIRQED